MVDFQIWLDALHAAGGDFIRVWMPAWALGIEWYRQNLVDEADLWNG
jgi:hypothetical protein